MKNHPVFKFHKLRFCTADDIAKHWPEDEVDGLSLDKRQKVWKFKDTDTSKLYVIVPEQELPKILIREYKQIPPALGMNKWHSLLSQTPHPETVGPAEGREREQAQRAA